MYGLKFSLSMKLFKKITQTSGILARTLMETIFSDTLMFYFMRRSSYNKSHTRIPFQINRLGSVTKATTTGNVSISKDGIYQFSLTGKKSASSTLEISLRLNEKAVGSTYGSKSNPSTFALQSILKLNKGDQIDLYLHKGKLIDTTEHVTHFTGSLLMPSYTTNQRSVKSAFVYFYLQKNSTYLIQNSKVSFEIERLNVGGALDIKTGIFTAPSDGFYYFSLSGINHYSEMRIHLRLNGVKIGAAFVSKKKTTYSLQSILQLKTLDKIDIFLEKGTCYDNDMNWTHFTGYRLFSNPSSDLNGAKPICFYVQKNTSYSKAKSSVPFELAKLNEGDAINVDTGVFTAPRDGIYHFSLSGIKDDSKIELQIYLRLNELAVGAGYVAKNSPKSTYSLHSNLSLKKGDTIDIFLFKGVVYDSKSHYTHFTGALIG